MTTNPHATLDLLKRFNAKERFHLLMYALGQNAPDPETGEYPSFQLGEKFRQDLCKLLGTKEKSLEDAFCAMDYHLDWIHAAVHAPHESSEKSDGTWHLVKDNEPPAIHGSQQDVDLLVAFMNDGVLQLIMFEAKYASGWDTDQLQKKINRLTLTFGENNCHGKKHKIQPYYILMPPAPEPPKQPKPLKPWKGYEFPDWLAEPKKKWPIQMGLTSFKYLRVTRCNAEEKSSAVGGHWRIVKRKLG